MIKNPKRTGKSFDREFSFFIFRVAVIFYLILVVALTGWVIPAISSCWQRPPPQWVRGMSFELANSDFSANPPNYFRKDCISRDIVPGAILLWSMPVAKETRTGARAYTNIE